MAFDDIQTGLTSARLAVINQLITQLEAELRFVIKLTPEERSSLNSIGNRRLAFVQKSFLYAKMLPHLLPGYRAIGEFERVHGDYESLVPVFARIKGLSESLNDTTLQIGANLVDYSLIFYECVGSAARGDVPGTETAERELATFFERNGNSRELLPDDKLDGTGTTLIPGNVPINPNSPQ